MCCSKQHRSEYQVFISESTRRNLGQLIGQVVSLQTIYTIDGDPSRGKVTPRLTGFLADVEREFFEMFCSVRTASAARRPYAQWSALFKTSLR